MRAARLAAGKTVAECAQAIGVSPETFETYEIGDRSPSLPELEALAYFLDVPIEHFWGREVISKGKRSLDSLDIARLNALRQRVVGAMLRQTRLESSLSPEQLAEHAGISPGQLAAFEVGEEPVPVPVLESLAAALNRPIRDFQDSSGPVGAWIARQRALGQFSELPAELQEFISKPVNRPYLELAKRLSEMSVEKLRAVAEGLLEITL